MERVPRSQSNKENTLLINEQGTDLSYLINQVNGLQTVVNGLVVAALIPPNIPPSVNQLFNGNLSHSWASWNNTGLTNDTNKETYLWFSQPTSANQVMTPNAAYNSNVTLTVSSVDFGADTITFTANHNLITGASIFFTSTGGVPPPLVASTLYFAIVVDADTIKVASSVANALAGTAINLSGAGSGTISCRYNYALKVSTNTYYSSYFADWDWATGTARLNTADTDISTYFSPTTIDPSYSFYVGMTLAFANQYITCTQDVRIGCGLYGYSTGDAEWDWISGAFEATAEVVGTVSTPTSRDYVIHAITDRGFTVQSTPLTVANAPSDADFNAGARVVLEWPQVLNYGILSYDIYRKTGATYDKLISIVTGQLSYIDNNVVSATVGGYPAATFDKLVAFTASQQGTLQALSYSGDNLVNQWGTIPYAIRVPYNYDKSDTDFTKKLWMRYYLTGVESANGRLDLTVDDGAIFNGDATLTSAAGQFSNTDPNIVGLNITVTDGTNTLTTTIATYVSATEITLTDDWSFASATDCTVYITGGAPSHPILTDLLFLDFRPGTGFAPNAEDISASRGVPPVTPNGSTQGGSGSGGGSGDGGIRCLSHDELVRTRNGDVAAENLNIGDDLWWNGGYNTIKKIKYGTKPVWEVVADNGASLKCTLTKQIFTSIDTKVPLRRLNVGDVILTSLDGETIEPAKIVSKTLVSEKGVVVQIGLEPDDHFLAGRNGYIVCSNQKPLSLD